MLKYGLLAKGIELMCFKPVFETMKAVYPDMNTDDCKKKVQKEFKSEVKKTRLYVSYQGLVCGNDYRTAVLSDCRGYGFNFGITAY